MQRSASILPLSRGSWIVATCLLIFLAAKALSGEAPPVLYPFTSEGKWGYIDSTGKWVIPPTFDRCREVFLGDRVTAWQGDKWGYIDRNGKWLAEPIFDAGGFSPEGSGVEVVGIGEKLGVLHRDGSLVLPVAYDDVLVSGDRVWVREADKVGIFSLEGKWILEPSLPWPAERPLPTPTANDQLAWFLSDGKWGLISVEGQTIFPPTFEPHIMGRHEAEEWIRPEGLDFVNGRAWVKEGGEYLLISSEGKELARFPFLQIAPWTDKLFTFTDRDRQVGLVSRNGEVVLPAGFASIGPVVEHRAVVTKREERPGSNGDLETFWTYGYLNDQGEMVIEPGTYLGPGVSGGGQTQLAPFSEGLAPVWNNGRENARRQIYDPCAGFIDPSGALVIAQQFYRTTPFSEGLAGVAVRKPREALSPERGLWGYVDRHGVMVIEPQFGQVTPFLRGRAWVLKAGERWDESSWAMIDREGNILTDFSFQPPERFASYRYRNEDRLPKSRWRGAHAVVTRYDFHNGLATADGKILVEPVFNTIQEFNDGVAVALDSRGRDEKGNVKWQTALLTESGEVLAHGEYTKIQDFDGGVAWATRRYSEKNGLYQDAGWGLLDTSARERTEFRFIRPSWVFASGEGYSSDPSPRFYGELAPVAGFGGYERRGLYTETVTDGWGYIDRQGQIVVWDDAFPAR